MQNRVLRGKVDPEGRLVLPPEILKRFGLAPGASFQIQAFEDQLVLSAPADSLRKVYVELTTVCNLACRTCMRNVWDELPGTMDGGTFQRILQGVRSFSPTPMIFFGGLGEPFAHPNLREMVTAARADGIEVELITNGTLLDDDAIHWLVEEGVRRVWVSIDGATPDSYSDVRLRDSFPGVVANLTRLREYRVRREASSPKLGIAFVAMQANLSELPEVVRLGQRLGADRISVSNVLAHTPALWDQALYTRSMAAGELQPSPWSVNVALPRIDFNAQTLNCLADVLNSGSVIQLAGQPLDWGVNRCPFLEKGSVSVRWDGAVSPCLPLLHTHVHHLAENQHTSHAYAVGNVCERSLGELWRDPGYRRLRERLQTFDFSSCTFCNSCDMAEANLQDCFGNSLPACGGCLWAQGFIRCP